MKPEALKRIAGSKLPDVRYRIQNTEKIIEKEYLSTKESETFIYSRKYALLYKKIKGDNDNFQRSVIFAANKIYTFLH